MIRAAPPNRHSVSVSVASSLPFSRSIIGFVHRTTARLPPDTKLGSTKAVCCSHLHSFQRNICVVEQFSATAQSLRTSERQRQCPPPGLGLPRLHHSPVNVLFEYNRDRFLLDAPRYGRTFRGHHGCRGGKRWR
jgi:hypothetical protein